MSSSLATPPAAVTPAPAAGLPTWPTVGRVAPAGSPAPAGRPVPAAPPAAAGSPAPVGPPVAARAKGVAGPRVLARLPVPAGPPVAAGTPPAGLRAPGWDGSGAPQGLGMKMRSRQMSIGRESRPANSGASVGTAPDANSAAATSAVARSSARPAARLKAGTSQQSAARPASRRPGPVSISRSAPAAASPSARAKATGEVSCVLSIDAMSLSAVTSAPVIVEISRRAGGRNEYSCTTLRIGATRSAIAGEYRANGESSRCARSRTAAAGPATTWQRGPS